MKWSQRYRWQNIWGSQIKFAHYVFFSITVDVCPRLPILLNMVYNISHGAFGDVVEALCDHGYSYGNGTIREYILCGEGGIWDRSPRPCVGKAIHNKYS